MAQCAACGQDNPPIARFCLACGASLAEAAPPSEERKLVTGLFVDVVGSTASAEKLDPEDVRARLGPFHRRVRQELERFGGTVEKFIGDAVFALFGAPVAREDDPERAVRAALAIVDAVAELNEGDRWLELEIRIGVTTGEALVMLDAKPSEGEWMAAGDVVNTAARIQSGARPGGILVGRLTYEATRHALAYCDAQPLEAKGKSEPIEVWEVVGVREAPAPVRPRLPLVGREAEVERLCALWDDVLAEHRPALATVVAPPGIGKTRLLEAVTERLGDAAAVHWGRCLSYGEGITYWPVVEIVKAIAGVRQSDDANAAAAKLGTLLESLPTADRDELRTMAAALSNLLGAERSPEGTYATAQIAQAELHWGIRRMLELVAATRPLVLVFEDVHWAEPTLLELVRFLLGSSAPLLVLGSARPELADDAPDFLAASRSVVELDALDNEASEALLARLLEGGTLAPETIEALLRNAGGNPLFLEETVRMLESQEPGAGELPVPTSLQSLIGSRLDQLRAGEKRLAQHASVVGGVFWSGAVAHLDDSAEAVEPGLDALERRDLIRARLESSIAEQREYAFKHLLIRDVAYARLPKGRRAALHVRFADWVQSQPGNEEDFVEILAYHLEQACRLAREVAHAPVEPPVAEAVAALTRAAEKAERREGIREAQRFYERALEVLDDEDAETAIELRLRRGRTFTGLGELRRADDELLDVAEAALATGRRDLRCGALVALGNIDYKLGRVAAARVRLDEAEAIAAEIGDRRLQVRAAYESAEVRADLEGAREIAVFDLQRALEIAELLDDRALRIEGHMRLGTILFNLCRLGEAEQEFARAAALAGEIGSHRDEARTTMQLAYVNYYRGDLADAERRALRASAWLERTGDTFFELQDAVLLAMLALANGDPVLAEQRLRTALPLALESGRLLVRLYRFLVEALVGQGRAADAAELAAFAERDVQPEDVYARATVRVAQGLAAAANEDEETANEHFREALELLERRRIAVFDLAEARLAWAHVLRRFGDEASAQLQFEQARETFAPMGARVLVAEIDAALAEPAGGAAARSPATGS